MKGGTVVSSHCVVRLEGEGNVALVVRVAAIRLTAPRPNSTAITWNSQLTLPARDGIPERHF